MRKIYPFALFKSRHACFLISAVLGISLMQGCYKRELQTEPGQSVRIAFDWSGFPDTQSRPSSMQLWFYGQDNAPITRISPVSVYEGMLAEGNYQILAYNPDATGVSYRNLDNFSQAEVYTLPQAEDDGALASPQFVYGASLGSFEVRKTGRNETTLIPHIYVHDIVLRVTLTGETISPQISASIGGMATGLLLSTGNPLAGGNGTVSGTLVPAGSFYEVHFSTIGNDGEHPSYLTLDITFADGSQRTILENVSTAISTLDTLGENLSLMIELDVDITLIDGVLTATLTDWRYDNREIDL